MHKLPHYRKAAETRAFVFYADYTTDDVIMYDKHENFICDGRAANESLFEAIDNGDLVWASPETMDYLRTIYGEVEFVD